MNLNRDRTSRIGQIVSGSVVILSSLLLLLLGVDKHANADTVTPTTFIAVDHCGLTPLDYNALNYVGIDYCGILAADKDGDCGALSPYDYIAATAVVRSCD